MKGRARVKKQTEMRKIANKKKIRNFRKGMATAGEIFLSPAIYLQKQIMKKKKKKNARLR
jgi:hypothetical protein